MGPIQTIRKISARKNPEYEAVAQAEASRPEAESTVLSLEKQIPELENSFSTLLGIVPTEIERGSC